MPELERIGPKEAAEVASKFYREVTGNYQTLSLEEIELREGYWYVTLGIPKTGGLVIYEKEYKIFKVNAKTGNVESMNLRK